MRVGRAPFKGLRGKSWREAIGNGHAADERTVPLGSLWAPVCWPDLNCVSQIACHVQRTEGGSGATPDWRHEPKLGKVRSCTSRVNPAYQRHPLTFSTIHCQSNHSLARTAKPIMRIERLVLPRLLHRRPWCSSDYLQRIL